MTSVDLELSPPSRLAIAYARADLRQPLTVLLAFDARIANIVARASEPMIAQMKLAWWYDAIAKDARAKPKGEPILQALNGLASPAPERSMLRLLDAWSVVLAAESWNEAQLNDFAHARSEAIFEQYAEWVGFSGPVSDAGRRWAVADLNQRIEGKAAIAAEIWPRQQITTRLLRPLSILAKSATNPSGTKMIWHALTGR